MLWNILVCSWCCLAYLFMCEGFRLRSSVLFTFFKIDLVIVISHDPYFQFSEISHLLAMNKTPRFSALVFLVPSQEAL